VSTVAALARANPLQKESNPGLELALSFDIAGGQVDECHRGHESGIQNQMRPKNRYLPILQKQLNHFRSKFNFLPPSSCSPRASTHRTLVHSTNPLFETKTLYRLGCEGMTMQPPAWPNGGGAWRRSSGWCDTVAMEGGAWQHRVRAEGSGDGSVMNCSMMGKDRGCRTGGTGRRRRTRSQRRVGIRLKHNETGHVTPNDGRTLSYGVTYRAL
jgi:hypothetical protein